MRNNQKLVLEQEKLNRQLAFILKENGIQNLRLLSLGNSIASGYSAVRIIQPLLLRNTTIEKVLTNNGIKLDIHHFARAQNNNDEHIYEWVISNIKESEIHKMNRNDYSDGPTSMSSHGLDIKKFDQYYPTFIEKDIGLQDAILESNPNMANIVIYNGCTGSFLDNITRNGKIHHMLTYGIHRDTIGLEATLKFILANNRKNNSNTQVYICGAPDFLGLKISEIINVRLKKIANQYPNTVYVKPVKSKFFYKPIDNFNQVDFNQFHTIFKRYFRQLDIHYDEYEYLKLNNHIIQSIQEQYLITNCMIQIDRSLYHFSSDLELNNHEMLKREDFIQQYFMHILTISDSKLPDYASKCRFYKTVKKYLIHRVPYDFHYIGKKNIYDSFKKLSYSIFNP